MYLTEKELCDMLKVDKVFLWNCRKKGMPFIRLGNKLIRYNIDDVIAWFKNQYQDNGGVA